MFTPAQSTHVTPVPESLQNTERPASMSPVHAIGDIVMHPSEGICVIEKIEAREFNASSMTYYVLKPKLGKSSSTVYLPVNRGNTLLRHLLVKTEIDQIIFDSISCPSLWIEDNKKRKKTFNDLLSEGDYVKLIRMIQDIHTHTEERIAEGKKPCTADETVCEEAERLLHHEFAYVLGLPVEEIAGYIQERLDRSPNA
ncbi:MAG: CarD family transcriptional regulator [Clostridia bacterium]|nr:CarD family transcriptional regulator [Clostridia bacterium]